MILHTTEQAKLSYVTEMMNNGVCVFKKKIHPDNIQLLINEIDNIKKIIMPKINTMERPLKTYSDIAERQLGRLDYRCGFTANIFSQVAHPIVQVINELSPLIDFNYYWGVITSLGGSGATDLHRDVYPILNINQGNHLDVLDMNLPPYYFTALIPLVEITPENGPTEFVKGSHRQPRVDENIVDLYAPLLTPGDVVIFEGRILHRGGANKTSVERLIAYVTFIANWYNDQTFVHNNYLFPELISL